MPMSVETALNQAVKHHLAGRYDLARDLYEQVISVNPDSARAHMNLGALQLLHGEFDAGWREFRWRRRGQANQLPLWDGSPLNGEGLLVRGEQGAGDNIQFIRYLPFTARMGGPVGFLTLPGMKRLLSSMKGDWRVLEPGDQASGLHAEIPVMDLPALAGTRVETVPAPVPYLHAEPALVEFWRGRLAPGGGRRIGLTWQGNPDNPRDQQRSVPLRRFAPLMEALDTRWFGLQVGPGEDQAAGFNAPGEFDHLGPELGAHSGKFVDDAAVIAHLDLVITVDTAIAHLAGAMGKPVWIVLPREADWRWLLARSDSPWYPTARLFRQSVSGDWDGPLAEMAEALATLAG